MKVILVGVGKLGHKLAEILISENIYVTIIERDLEVISRLEDQVDALIIQGNGLDIGLLRELGMEDYDLLVSCTGLDETNILICGLAKKLGLPMVVGRIRSPEYLDQVDFLKKELGIDHIINPDLATAEVIEKYLLKSHTFYSDGFVGDKVQMLDFNVDLSEDFVGKKISELKGFDKLLITAISREGEIIIPNGNTRLKAFDLIYLMGKKELIEEFAQIFDEDRQENLEDIMILGGSNLAYYLAKNLSKIGKRVKIIEKNKKTARLLSETLDDVLIINGDGTDLLLLEKEELEDMDALIATTGYDESNLLMGIMAKQLGVPKVIAKISRENYSRIMDRLEIDAVFNPAYIVSSNILKIIRGGRIQSISLLIGGEGEVVEIVLSDNLSVLNKSLKDLDLPEGTIIGAVGRGDKIFIPDGNTRLEPKDRIVVFSLRENLKDLKQFFQPKKRGGLLSGLWNSDKNNR